MGVRCSNASFEKHIFCLFELRVQTRNFDYLFLASKFDARGDAGELSKDFPQFSNPNGTIYSRLIQN